MMISERRRKGSSTCLRYILIITNCLFLVISAATVSVIVYLCIDQISFIKGVLGTDLVIAASGLIMASGCLLFIWSILGIVGAALENTVLLILYFSIMIVLFLSFLSGVICLAIYKTWLTDQARFYMEDNIKNIYGINLSNKWNKQVTESWDKAQSKWKCCSVGDLSWAIYQQSEWYKIQPGVRGKDKPYVPSSCCVKDDSGQIKDIQECQTKQDGPPAIELGNQYAGNVNTALYYRGCYEAAKDYIQSNQLSWYTIMIGIGIGLAILMNFGMCIAVALFCILRRDRESNQSSIMLSRYPNNSKTMLEPDYYMYSAA